jgi:N-acyl-L-homoserine lactone synthetase
MSQTSAVRAKSVWKGGLGPAEARPGGLRSVVIDDDSALLEQSYNLRYQVYCVERGFLPAGDYPDQQEIDEFDAHSVHIGVLNTEGQLVGTGRLVEPSAAGLPLLQHCELFEDTPLDTQARAVEVSRLAVSREVYRREGADLVLHISKGLYQASKRRGFTHWLAATERSLQRLMIKYGFPWKVTGPETDYYGLVSPYLMNLREFDQVILSGRIGMLSEFLDGLEPQFRPRDIWQLIEALQ